MFEGLRRYIAHTGSNLIGFSTAIGQSVSSLVPDRAATIAKSLFYISVTDFLPAAMAFTMNGYLQDSFTQYAEEQSEEGSAYRNGIILVATSMNLLFFSFSAPHTIRGGARTVALIATIPHLLQEESTDAVPQAELYNSETLRVNLNRFKQGLEFMSGHVIDMGVEAMLPEHYIAKFIVKLWVGHEIVNGAVNRNDLMRLYHLQIKSLPLLVGGAYFLGSYIKDLALLGSTNPYLDLLIDNCLLISLFAVMANLKLRNVNLQSESHPLDVPQGFASSILKELLYSFSKKIRNLTTTELRNILTAMGVYTEVSLTIAKVTVLPTMLHSPKKFFDDEMISKLLQSLPQEVKLYLHDKYSQEQIEIFLGHLEIKITKQTAPRYVKDFCSFFATKKWTDEFQSKLRLVNERIPMGALETENTESDNFDRSSLFFGK